MGRTSPKKARRKAPAKSSATRGGSNGSPVTKAARAAAKRQVKAPKRDDELVADAVKETGGARVHWDKRGRTDRLLAWLATNVNERLKIFSDSTQDANEQGRRKQTSKTAKMTYYMMMADAVFSVDEDEKVRADYEQHPEHYGKSVENVLGRLRKRYRDANKTLGQTGAGLRVEDVTPGSDIANQIEQIKVDFPYWEQLHGFWRTLPNFNPYTASSEPGQNIADQALALITGDDPVRSPANSGPDADGDLFNFDGLERTQKRSRTPERSPTSTHSPTSPIPWSPTPTKKKPIEVDGTPGSSPPPKLEFKLPIKSSALQNSNKGNVQSSTHSSTASSASSGGKKRNGKRSRADAFAEETEKQNKILQDLGKDKHERRMAELSVKRQKLELDLQRDNLAAEERRFAAEDRRRESEYKREREREQHRLLMMRMQFAMQRGSNGNGEGFGNNSGFFGNEMNFGDGLNGVGGFGGFGEGYFNGAGSSGQSG